MIFDKKPDVANLWIFGTVGLTHIPKEVRERKGTQKKCSKTEFPAANVSKLGSRTEDKIFIGCSDTGYQMMDPQTKKLSHPVM